MTDTPRIAALVVAGGRGRRAGGGVPKQYRPLAGRPVLGHTLERLLGEDAIAAVVVAIHPDDAGLYAEAAAPFAGDARLRPAAEGGAERQQSVLAGLEALAAVAPDFVLIHDAVRPFVGRDTIAAVISALVGDEEGACAGVPVVDTVRRCNAAGVAVETVPREGLWRAATPQGFRFGAILAAHRVAAARGEAAFTDDAAVFAAAGGRVRMIASTEDNVKLTTPEDFAAAEARLAREAMLALADIRVGSGYDVHVLEPGDGVTLGGVHIPHDRRLKGHSDADVALHALTDAILGAIGDGDIGRHFPPSDMRWRGAASAVFLADAAERVRARGGMIAHLDVSIVAEEPKIGPHREAMRAEIARIAGIAIDRVGVKATTNEKIGFVGRGEGIAALATATIRLPL